MFFKSFCSEIKRHCITLDVKNRDDVMTDQQMPKVDHKIRAHVTAMTSDPTQF